MADEVESESESPQDEGKGPAAQSDSSSIRPRDPAKPNTSATFRFPNEINVADKFLEHARLGEQFAASLTFNVPDLDRLAVDFLAQVNSPIATSTTAPSSAYSSRKAVDDLNARIASLHKELARREAALEAARMAADKRDAEGFRELKRDYERLLKQSQDDKALALLVNRIRPEAQALVLQDSEFKDRFFGKADCNAFVLAVDIRRSTELMLKARSAEHFERFTRELCNQLIEVVIQTFGVFDKFTGDGILAFYPDFYSGPSAPYLLVQAAESCHEVFRAHYRAHRRGFTAILNDVGLGIGIDYGPVRLVQIASSLTVVGSPVVYACRLSGAAAHVTLANQGAYERINDEFGPFVFSQETEHLVKHEGPMAAYSIKRNAGAPEMLKPIWMKQDGIVAPGSAPDPT